MRFVHWKPASVRFANMAFDPGRGGWTLRFPEGVQNGRTVAGAHRGTAVHGWWGRPLLWGRGPLLTRQQQMMWTDGLFLRFNFPRSVFTFPKLLKKFWKIFYSSTNWDLPRQMQPFVSCVKGTLHLLKRDSLSVMYRYLIRWVTMMNSQFWSVHTRALFFLLESKNVCSCMGLGYRSLAPWIERNKDVDDWPVCHIP